MKKLFNYKDRVIFFILTIFLLIKLYLFSYIPLVNDEAYTLTISRQFSLSYFDHPPLTMWILYFLSQNLNIENSSFFRIPFIFFGVFSSYFLFLIGKILYSTKVGIISAMLYFLSPFFFFSGGLLIVPDAPLNFFILAALYFSLKIIFVQKENHLIEWLLLGIFLALSFLSKYQSYFFGLFLLIYFLCWKKELFFSKNFALAFIIASTGLLPVIIWNIQNDFASFAFHQSRSSFNFQLSHFTGLLFVQLFFVLPSTGILIFLNFFACIKKKVSQREKFIFFLAFPPLLLFNLLNFVSINSFAHWSMFGWMLLIPSGASFLTSLNLFKLQTYFLKILNVILAFSLILIILIHANNGFLTLRSQPDIPKWDNTKEILDWSHIVNVLKNNLSKKEIESIVTMDWYYSGQLNTAFDFKYDIGVIGDNDHHFRYLNIPKKQPLVLLDIKLLNELNDPLLNEKLIELKYITLEKKLIPFYRGKSIYGHIKIYKIKRK